jgi:hypothetical protein
MRFVLEAIDPETGCPMHDVALDVDDVGELGALIRLEGVDDLLAGHEFQLDPTAVLSLCRRYGFSFDDGGHPVVLCKAAAVHELSYRVHTRRELALMLAGTKPLAVFKDLYPLTVGIIPERLFEPHVLSGRFVKRTVSSRPALPGLPWSYVVLYARPGEEWRIDAYLLLWNTAAKTSWNEGFERIEGTLLGYEEWQNDEFLRRFPRDRPRFSWRSPDPSCDPVTPLPHEAP